MSESDEDKWLAYELHDRLLPWIHGARMQLANLRVAPEGQEQLDLARQCLTMAAEEGRALIGFVESRTMEASTDSLEIVIRKFVAVTQPLALQSQQEIRLIDPFDVGSGWSASEAWTILRIIQQAVQNAIQHAGPCAIELYGSVSNGGLLIEVRDSGRGFDSSNIPSGHFGVSSMKERAESIGAELQIRSDSGRGTVISLKVPRL